MDSRSKALQEIRMLLQASDPAFVPGLRTSFAARSIALDRLEVEGLDRLEILNDASAFDGLRDQILARRTELEILDQELFQALRAEIRAGLRGLALKNRLAEITAESTASANPANPTTPNHSMDFGYDALDILLNEVLTPGEAPREILQPEPEMVYFQKTPGRVLFEVAEILEGMKSLRDEARDVFYDLGSGLGQVSLLVNLLTGVKTKGVEVEPAYVSFSRRCAEDLGISGVDFVNADVRDVDLSDGTVFFLYTPFTGSMLNEVLEKLRAVATSRSDFGIRVLAYGPCTSVLAACGWLFPDPSNSSEGSGLSTYRSVESSMQVR